MRDHAGDGLLGGIGADDDAGVAGGIDGVGKGGGFAESWERNSESDDAAQVGIESVGAGNGGDVADAKVIVDVELAGSDVAVAVGGYAAGQSEGVATLIEAAEFHGVGAHEEAKVSTSARSLNGEGVGGGLGVIGDRRSDQAGLVR